MHFVLALSLSLAASTQAEGRRAATEGEVHPLRANLLLDAALTSGLLAGLLLSEGPLKPQLAPASCRWCDRAAGGSEALNALDAFGRGLRAAPSQLLAMDLYSNLLLALVPVTAAGLELYLAHSAGALHVAPLDLLLIAEATAAAAALTQVVKFFAGRERPFVHVLPEEEKPLTRAPADNNLSFYSGHSSIAFALAVGSGTVAQLRGWRRAWLVFAVSLPLAVAVPLLRMAADRHYLTDVLVGSAAGAAFGYALPTFFHGRASSEGVRLLPAPGGAALAGTF